MSSVDAPVDDGSDDFDFVRADNGSLAFRALDREPRTDTWLSNADELRRADPLDPWDADTDNDGLTDGQEARWITTAPERTLTGIRRDGDLNSRDCLFGCRPTFDTDPHEKDTDGDGYWDGWFGVFGAENSTNVVLYMEHLVDDDDGNQSTEEGVEGPEIVPEQRGFHQVTFDARVLSPFVRGADIDGDGDLEHSNVHIGDLHWGTAPDKKGSNAEGRTSLGVEVDYYARADKRALAALEIAERTYQLYGLNVTFSTDDEINNADLQCVTGGGHLLCGPFTPPTNLIDAHQIENSFHDDNSKLYMFVSTDGGSNGDLVPDWAPDVEGVASSQGFNGVVLGRPEGLGFGVLLFTKDHDPNVTGENEGPRKLHMAKTTTHEVGHIIGAGRPDDSIGRYNLPEEVYSGRLNDDTPEEVGYSGSQSDDWSVMSSGWNDPIDNQPMSGRYIAFSIEELSTVEFRNLDTVAGR